MSIKTLFSFRLISLEIKAQSQLTDLTQINRNWLTIVSWPRMHLSLLHCAVTNSSFNLTFFPPLPHSSTVLHSL